MTRRSLFTRAAAALGALIMKPTLASAEQQWDEPVDFVYMPRGEFAIIDWRAKFRGIEYGERVYVPLENGKGNLDELAKAVAHLQTHAAQTLKEICVQ